MKFFRNICIAALAASLLSACFISAPTRSSHPTAPTTTAPALPEDQVLRRALQECHQQYSQISIAAVKQCQQQALEARRYESNIAKQSAQIDIRYRQVTSQELNDELRRQQGAANTNTKIFRDTARGAREWVRAIREMEELF